jgi:hypothetical protein
MTLPNRQTVDDLPRETQSDRQVEKLVSDIAGVIRSARPEERGELKELAETLLRDEISSIMEQPPAAQTSAAAPRFNPLLPGILLTLLGVGFLLLFPLVGFALAGIGAALMIWGALLSWLRN